MDIKISSLVPGTWQFQNKLVLSYGSKNGTSYTKALGKDLDWRFVPQMQILPTICKSRFRSEVPTLSHTQAPSLGGGHLLFPSYSLWLCPGWLPALPLTTRALSWVAAGLLEDMLLNYPPPMCSLWFSGEDEVGEHSALLTWVSAILKTVPRELHLTPASEDICACTYFKLIGFKWKIRQYC